MFNLKNFNCFCVRVRPWTTRIASEWWAIDYKWENSIIWHELIREFYLGGSYSKPRLDHPYLFDTELAAEKYAKNMTQENTKKYLELEKTKYNIDLEIFRDKQPSGKEEDLAEKQKERQIIERNKAIEPRIIHCSCGEHK